MPSPSAGRRSDRRARARSARRRRARDRRSRGPRSRTGRPPSPSARPAGSPRARPSGRPSPQARGRRRGRCRAPAWMLDVLDRHDRADAAERQAGHLEHALDEQARRVRGDRDRRAPRHESINEFARARPRRYARERLLHDERVELRPQPRARPRLVEHDLEFRRGGPLGVPEQRPLVLHRELASVALEQMHSARSRPPRCRAAGRRCRR